MTRGTEPMIATGRLTATPKLGKSHEGSDYSLLLEDAAGAMFCEPLQVFQSSVDNFIAVTVFNVLRANE